MPYKKGEPILWEHLTWDEAEAICKKMKMAIICVGAIEQHGPHLPVNVDISINYEIGKRISAATGVPVLPPIFPGVSESHGFSGTIFVRPETLSMMMYDICRSLYEKNRIKKILVINGHMWNQAANLAIRDNMRCDYEDLQIRVLNWWDFDPEVYALVASDCPLGRSLHANIGETSCMLAISPELCDMKKAKLLKVDNPEYPHFWDYREEEMTKSGVMGSAATKATAELGEKILSMAAGKLIREVKKALKEKPRYKAPNKLARAPRGKESKRS